MAYYADTVKMTRYTPFATEFHAVPFDITVTVASTQIDDVTDTVINVLGPFGANQAIFNAAGWTVTPTDMDTHATPTLTFDFQISSALAGTSPTVLISNSAAAQSAAADLLDTPTTAENTSLSGKYLQIKIEDDVATAAAGSFRVRGWVYNVPPARTIALDAVAAV